MKPKITRNFETKSKPYLRKAENAYRKARIKYGVNSKEELTARISHHKAIVRQTKEKLKSAKNDEEKQRLTSYIWINEKQAKMISRFLERKK